MIVEMNRNVKSSFSRQKGKRGRHLPRGKLVYSLNILRAAA